MKTLRTAASALFATVLALSAAEGGADTLPADGLYAVIHTPKGEITAELFPEKAPLAVANFVGLAEGTIAFEGRPGGAPFFDGLVFHRVVPEFVIQGGDPLGTGEGGPGYEFADEFTQEAKHVKGALAMANSGPNTNGSQFYFAIEPVHRLNYKHTVFGVVRSGMEVVTAIAEGDAMERVEIVRVGAGAQAFHPDAESFATLRASARVIQPRDPALAPLFSSEIDFELPDWFPQWIQDKLNHYHQVRGTEIFVRAYCSPLDVPGAADGSLRTLFDSLAAGDANACLLVYIDEEKRWRIWIGDALVPLVADPSGRVESEQEKESLRAAKAGILATAKAEIEAGKPRRSIDAAVTSLIETLDAKTLRR